MKCCMSWVQMVSEPRSAWESSGVTSWTNSIYRRGFGLELNLHFWKFWIPSYVGQVEPSAEERVREEREEIFSSFPRLPRYLPRLKGETNPTIHVLLLFMHYSCLLFIYFYFLHYILFTLSGFTYFSIFFLLDKHKGTVYKDTDVQKILEIFYLDWPIGPP